MSLRDVSIEFDVPRISKLELEGEDAQKGLVAIDLHHESHEVPILSLHYLVTPETIGLDNTRVEGKFDLLLPDGVEEDLYQFLKERRENGETEISE